MLPEVVEDAIEDAVECHILSLLTVFEPDLDERGAVRRHQGTGAPGGFARRPPKQVVTHLGRLLLATVLAERVGAGSPLAVRLGTAVGGKPVLVGEHPDGASAGIAHDQLVLVVGYHPRGCAVDVEDADPALLHDVAYRFCAPEERRRHPDAQAARALWAAKEAVVKFSGAGLRAGLRRVTFEGDPTAGWVRARCPGNGRPPLCRVVEAPGRHLAFAVGAGQGAGGNQGDGGQVAPRVEVRHWSPTFGLGAWPARLVPVPPPVSGPVAALARAVRATNRATNLAASLTDRAGDLPTRDPTGPHGRREGFRPAWRSRWLGRSVGTVNARDGSKP